jgi:hypothetical protein
MPHQGKCQDDHNGVTKSLRYERQCDNFIQMDDDQRTAKREAWERVWNPPVRAKTEIENE